MSSAKPLEGKVAVVTGASRGIGLAIAQRLGEMGAKLGLCSRDPKKLEAATQQLRTVASAVFAMPVDVTRADQISSFVQAAKKNLGPIDILVNNAVVSRTSPTWNASAVGSWHSTSPTSTQHNMPSMRPCSVAGVSTFW